MIIPDKELVRTMDIAAPRYTSYPTIPVWKRAESNAAYIEALERHDAAIPLTLYFHVPYCPVICHYCGCNTQKLESPGETAPYVTALLEELRLVHASLRGRHRVAQIHWGGGTPSTLQNHEFQAVLGQVRELFDVDADAELAIETNPMTCPDEKLEFLLGAGFNRLSIGVQDFDAEVQTAIGRNQTFERTAAFCERIRAQGVRSLNFDLVYGLPKQNVAKLDATMRRVAELGPDRIAVYSFAFLPVLRDNQKNIVAEDLPSPDVKFDLYLLTIQRLLDAGYEMIGMDHFAKPSDELSLALRERRLRRNFMGYTTKAETDVLALGATSIGDVSGYYCQNIKETCQYIARMGMGELAVEREMSLDEDDLIRRRVIMDLLCNGVVVKREIAARFSIDFEAYFEKELAGLGDLAAQGMVVHSAEAVEATALGRYFLRNIALHFDNFFDGRKGKGGGATFSRTV